MTLNLTLHLKTNSFQFQFLPHTQLTAYFFALSVKQNSKT